MSERRLDVTTGEWTTIATHRQDRTFLPAADACPLCPSATDGETEIAEPYDIVVFDNRFPSMSATAGSPPPPASDLQAIAPGKGAAEVVVYSPDHLASLAAIDVDRIARIVAVWADRYAELGAREEVAYVFIFENKGVEMGVTLHHPHGQIYGFPDIPPRARAELHAARRHIERTERCVFCDVVATERADGVRVVAENRSFIAFVPFAARFPYEVHVMTRRHAPSLLDLTERERRALAEILKQVLVAYDGLYGFSMPYVMAMHQAPTDDGQWQPVSHLHLEFYPPYRTAEKLKYIAGSELGAGAFMNDTLPEETAAALRAALGA